MKAFGKLFLLVFTSFVLVACGSVYIKNVDVSQKPIVSNNPNQTLSLDQVRSAILQAGAKRGWVMKQEGTNKIIATQGTSYNVVVEIPFTEKSYSINYVSSTNFYERDGKIHRKYATWVGNLQRDIDEQLATK